MIVHTLETASACGLFETIHVSTEDDAIAEVCEERGFGPDFPRPIDLADDHTPLLPVLKFVADTYRRRDKVFDEIWLLMACAPLVAPSDLLGASDMFEKAGNRIPMIGVSAFPVPIEWAFDLEPSGRLRETQPGMFAVRSQDLPVRYFDAGVFSVFPQDYVLDSDGAGDATEFLGYELPRYKAIDIDTSDDWDLAERLFNGSSRV